MKILIVSASILVVSIMAGAFVLEHLFDWVQTRNEPRFGPMSKIEQFSETLTVAIAILTIGFVIGMTCRYIVEETVTQVEAPSSQRKEPKKYSRYEENLFMKIPSIQEHIKGM